MQDEFTSSRTAAGGGADKSQTSGGETAGVTETVKREMEDAKSRLAGATEEVRREAAGAGGTISTLVSEQAERRKEEAADGLRAFASAIREASDELGERDRTMSARFVQEAAHGLERFSDSLQSRSVSDMTRSVAAFGRENPATFLSVCLFAGIAAGRFLIASGARADRYGDQYRSGDRWRDDSFDRSGSYGGSRGDQFDRDEGRTGGYGSSSPGYGGGYGASSQGGAGYGGAASNAGGYAGGAAGAAQGGGVGAGVYSEGGSLSEETERGGLDEDTVVGRTGAGVLGEGDTDVTRQAGTFGSTVAPSSEQRAPGDLDALGTQADDSEPTFPVGGPIDEDASEGSSSDDFKKKEDRDGDN